MIYETTLGGKDSVRLHCLRSVTSGKARLFFQSGSERMDYVTQLRQEGSRVSVWGGCTLTEDALGEILTLRPMTADQSVKIFLTQPRRDGDEGSACGTVEIYRKEIKAVERAFDVTPQLRYTELTPRAEGGFLLRLCYDDSEEPEGGDTGGCTQPEGNTADASENMSDSASEIARLEENNQNKETRRKETRDYIEKLKRIEAAYDKDYAGMQEEIAACRERLGADSKVLAYYRDRDFVPAEQLQSEIAGKLDELEAQIRLFIEQQQERSLQIENAVKSGGSSQGGMSS